MRKLFLFLFAALMSVGMYATTVVTITQNDFPQHGTSFTKDGVTVSAGNIDGMDGNLRKGGSFSTTLGNFTKIVVTAEGCEASGTGWSGNWSSMTWAGTPASTVSFSGEFMGMGMGITIVCTIAESTVAVTGVTLDQNEAQMTVGEELTLTATVNPGNATNKDVMWSSDNGYVATIENGVITAEGEGTATITVTTTDGSYTATCDVTVTAPEPTPQGQTIEGGQDPEHTTYYYSTFFDSQVKYLLPEGVEAYVAELSGDALTLTKIAVAGQTIPANNAVIFRANAKNFTLTPSTADAVTISVTNDLKGTDSDINAEPNCYVLSNEDNSDEDGVIGFYKYTGSLLNAHKAYIIFNGPSSAPRRMRFIFAEEQNTTALDNAETDNMSVKVIENGQLVIIRNGVRYNAAGQVIE